MEPQPPPLGYLETQSRLPVSLTRPILIGQRQPRPTLPPRGSSHVLGATSVAWPLPSQTVYLQCLSRLFCRANSCFSFRSSPPPRTCLTPTPAPILSAFAAGVSLVPLFVLP